MFSGKIKPTACGVVNMDLSTGPGTHFTCYFNHPKDKFVYYFDSYGTVPPILVENYLKTSGKIISYNTSQLQPIASVLCGYYCIYVIQRLARGDSFNDVLLSFSYDPDDNDDMMKKVFNLS